MRADVETKSTKEHEAKVAELESTIAALKADLPRGSDGSGGGAAAGSDAVVGKHHHTATDVANLRHLLKKSEAEMHRVTAEMDKLKATTAVKAPPSASASSTMATQVAAFVAGGVAVAAYFIATTAAITATHPQA